jgi:sialic acid synthase SpsE
MQTMDAAFPYLVGYSDHSRGVGVPVAAVAKGAHVIEKHLTLDKSASGPDHSASSEPDLFRQLVEEIRRTEEAEGDGVKEPADSEMDMREKMRRQLVYSSDLRAGEKLTSEDLAAKRPGTGFSPMGIDEIVGARLQTDVVRDQAVDRSDFEFGGDER